ncbi:MAG TPA: hypothetical protein VMD31_02765 [Opitutaceae bacterium]|nr:hypothetical protein [Opitutaceae bacterium]
MKTPKFVFWAAAMAATLALAGCSTPESRIRNNPAVFSRLTPEEQAHIRMGQIAVGFDPQMVELALGEPDHVTTRTTAEGASEVWHYTTYDLPDGAPLYRGWYHRYYFWGDPLYPYYLDYPYRREHDHIRVTFTNGKVSSIEEETR